MTSRSSIFGIPLSQVVSSGTFIVCVVSIWIHLEVRIAEVNIEIENLKQDINVHKTDNRRDYELLHNDMHEISGKIDEIQIYLRNKNAK